MKDDKTFEVLESKDEEVLEDKDKEVKVSREVVSTVEEVWTLTKLEGEKAFLLSRIAELQKKVDEFDSLIAEIKSATGLK